MVVVKAILPKAQPRVKDSSNWSDKSLSLATNCHWPMGKLVAIEAPSHIVTAVNTDGKINFSLNRGKRDDLQASP